MRRGGVVDTAEAEVRIRSNRGPTFFGGFNPWTPTNLQTLGNWSQFSAELSALCAATTVTDSLNTPAGTYPGSYAFQGGVLLPDGRVFCVPYNSTTARIYNPTTDTLSTPTGAYLGGGGFVGGVLLPDGRVFCVPVNSATARVYDATVNTAPPPIHLAPSAYFNKY